MTGNSEADHALWVIHGERLIDENPHIRVSLADVELPDGATFTQYVFRLRRCVIVLVLDEPGSHVLLMWRHTPSQHAWMSPLQPADPDLRFDPSVPHPARVYAYWLGGKDHYPADRHVAEEVIRRRPQVVAGARANRAFLIRVVRFLAAECGIRQFLDIGTGLPASDNTHEVAQAITPDSCVVYVDNDPLVLVHARALLTSTGRGSCDHVDADLRDTPAILAGAARTLDFTRPTAILLLAVLHFISDADDPPGIVTALARQLAPGSFVVISHLTSDFAPDPVTAGVAAYNTLVPTALIPRSHAQVSALFGELPLVPPGVVPLTEWRPTLGEPSLEHADIYAGVACISGRSRRLSSARIQARHERGGHEAASTQRV